MSFSTFDLLTLVDNAKSGSSNATSNQNKVLIVLSENEDEDLRNNLLPKIMQAVNIDLDKEAVIVDVKSHNINILQLIKELGVSKVIAFGVTPKSISLNLSGTLYILKTINEVQFLFSDSLSIISTKQDRKKALWANLQTLFPQ